jgi:hypothetical protein
LALTDKDMQVKFEIFWNAKIGNLWVNTTIIFQKDNISWPQQPPTERVSDISKKFDFL